jgi:lipoate-protein ligase B
MSCYILVVKNLEGFSKVYHVLRLGIVDYGQAHDLQKKILQERIDGKCPDHLILLQHNPVITVGRSGDNNNILASKALLESFGISVYEIERGGDVTYHGPGQLTGYPIIDLRNYKKDVHWYLRQLEEVIIRVLAEYDIIGERVEKYTGVWVGGEKIAAIGVAVKRWVTYHGFAFNINPDLSHFKLINPCGITDKEVTSLIKILGYNVSMEEVEDKVVSAFAEVFNVEITDKEIIYEFSRQLG